MRSLSTWHVLAMSRSSRPVVCLSLVLIFGSETHYWRSWHKYHDYHRQLRWGDFTQLNFCAQSIFWLHLLFRMSNNGGKRSDNGRKLAGLNCGKNFACYQVLHLFDFFFIFRLSRYQHKWTLPRPHADLLDTNEVWFIQRIRLQFRHIVTELIQKWNFWIK